MEAPLHTIPQNSDLLITGYEPIMDNLLFGKYLNPAQSDLLIVQKFRKPELSDIYVNLLPLMDHIGNHLPSNPISRTEFYLRCLHDRKLYDLRMKAEKSLQERKTHSIDDTTGDLTLYIRKGRFPTDLVDSIQSSSNPHHSLIRYLPTQIYDEGCEKNYPLKTWVNILFKHVNERSPIFGERWCRTISIERGFLTDDKLLQIRQRGKKGKKRTHIGDVVSSLRIIFDALRKNPEAVNSLDDISPLLLAEETFEYAKTISSFYW